VCLQQYNETLTKIMFMKPKGPGNHKPTSMSLN